MNLGQNGKIKISDNRERISYCFDVSKNKERNFKYSNQNENHYYKYLSVFGPAGLPDILYDGQFILAKECKIKDNEEQFSSEITEDSFCFSFSKDSEYSEDDEIYEQLLLKKRLRYFNIYDISNKCTKCNKGGHLGIVCDLHKLNENFCYRCMGNDHLIDNCKNFKCFKCNKIGHKINECKANEEIKCKRCNMLGHFQDDCLKYPIIKEKINLDLCLSFDKRRSFLSDITNIKKLFLFDEQNLEEKNLRKLIKNFTCPKCAGNHLLDKCPKKLYNDPRDRKNFTRGNKRSAL
jgi:hypothetical protein